MFQDAFDDVLEGTIAEYRTTNPERFEEETTPNLAVALCFFGKEMDKIIFID